MKGSVLAVIFLQTVLFNIHLFGSTANVSNYSFRWQALSHAFEACDCNTASKQPKFVCMKLDNLRESNKTKIDTPDNLESPKEIIVSNDNCASISKPFTMGRPCPEQCPHEWVTEQFSPCSKRCGKGTQIRRVKCGNRLHRGYTAPNEFLCHTSLLPKPVSTRNCALIDCPPQFVTSDWSKECHPLSTNTYCGIGYNVRSLGCEQTLANSNVVQSLGCTEQHKPDMFRDCYKPCPGLAFDATLMTKESRLNESGQYFLLSGQKIILDCNSVVAICQSEQSAIEQNTNVSMIWKYNGQFFDQKVDRGTGKEHLLPNQAKEDGSDETRDGFQLVIHKFEQHLHMGRYECILYSTNNNNIPRQNCQQTMQFNLIHISESILEKADYWSTKNDVKIDYTTTADAPGIKTPSYTSRQEKEGCITGTDCSPYEWLATDWSEDCYPLMRQVQPSLEINSSDPQKHSSLTESAMCIGSQGRFVWCAPAGDPSEHVPSSSCDPESRPASVRQCVLKAPC